MSELLTLLQFGDGLFPAGGFAHSFGLETYEVRADGEPLTCEPARVLPMAQRYFLF